MGDLWRHDNVDCWEKISQVEDRNLKLSSVGGGHETDGESSHT